MQAKQLWTQVQHILHTFYNLHNKQSLGPPKIETNDAQKLQLIHLPHCFEPLYLQHPTAGGGPTMTVQGYD